MAEMILSGFAVSRGLFRQNRMSAFAAVVLAAIVLTAFVGPLIWPHAPGEIDLDNALLAPSLLHPFGTDNHGRDVLARTLAGARISLGIGIAATMLSLLIGTTLGVLGGVFGRPIDSFVAVFTDVTLAFPSLLLAIAISVVIPPGITSVFVALSAVGWPTFARLSRSVVISIKQTEYFTAATAAGCAAPRLMLKHVLPNCMPLLIVAASLRLGGFMLGEAALSFLGLGYRLVGVNDKPWSQFSSYGSMDYPVPWHSNCNHDNIDEYSRRLASGLSGSEDEAVRVTGNLAMCLYLFSSQSVKGICQVRTYRSYERIASGSCAAAQCDICNGCFAKCGIQIEKGRSIGLVSAGKGLLFADRRNRPHPNFAGGWIS